MRAYSIIIATLAASLSAAPAFSQQTTLTIDEAIALAIANNPQLEMAQLETRKADYQVREALGNALPNVSASGQYTRSIKKPVFFVPRAMFQPGAEGYTTLEFGLDNTFQFGITASQVLFNSIVFTGVGTAKIYQRASREALRNEYNKTIADVKRSFHGVLLLRSVRDMMQAGLKNAEDNLRTVESMNRQGLVSDYDLIRAQVQVDNVKPGVVEADRNVVVALNGLKMLVGLPPSQEVVLRGDLEFVPADPSLVERAEQLVLTGNAGLKALELQKQVNQELISLYRAESYPTLSAFGNYQWQSQKNDFKVSTSDLVAQSQIGLTLNINLFNGFQSSARSHQAEVEYLKSGELFSMTRDALISQVQNIRLRLEEARKRIESQTKTVEQAEKGYKIATVRYASGTGTQLEVNDADLALMRSRVNRIQAVYDYILARTDLEELLSLEQPDSN